MTNKRCDFCGNTSSAILEAREEIAALRRQLAEAQESADALDAKVIALAPHGTCGCSYDRPGDLCMHHSPQIAALRARVETLEQISRDARPFCLGLGEGFADGCAIADRIDAALSGKE